MGGVGQQEGDGGGCATMREGSEGVEGLGWCMCGWVSLARPSLLGTVFFRTALPCAGGYQVERGGMPLHDAVGMDCEGGAATEGRDAAVKYVG